MLENVSIMVRWKVLGNDQTRKVLQQEIYESYRVSRNDRELYGLLQQWALSTKITGIDTDGVPQLILSSSLKHDPPRDSAKVIS